MTKLFEEVTLRFDHGDGDGPKDYPIPPEKIFGAIATVEEHVTLKELAEGVARTGKVSLTRIALAYAAVLKYAGAKNVTPDQVYVSMFNQGVGEKAVISALNGLLGLMIPPAAVEAAAKKVEEETGKPGEPSALPEIRAAS